jgi:hypothetical protein
MSHDDVTTTTKAIPLRHSSSAVMTNSDSMLPPAGNYPTDNNHSALPSKAMSQSTISLGDNRLITALPSEILSNIFKSIEASSDLLNLMNTCKSFTRPAERVLWEVCNTKGYAKLLKMETEQQDTFARWIQDQTIIFEENGFRPTELTLRLPQLRVLRIMHSSNDPIGKVEISAMITPCLDLLEVINGKTDDFLAALGQAKVLKHLIIGDKAYPEGGDLKKFVHFVGATPSLLTLHAGDLSSDDLFIEAASHKAIEDLASTTQLTLSTVVQSLKCPLPFGNLRRLRLITSASAVSILLPKLPRLESLELTVSQTLLPGQTSTSAAVDVFRAIGTLSKIKELALTIRLSHARAIVNMFDPLTKLLFLSKLTLAHNIEPNHHISSSKHFLPLSSDCPLEHLELDLQQRIPHTWINNLASTYPQLKTLSLGRSVKIRMLNTHFPALEKLCLISPNAACDSENM